MDELQAAAQGLVDLALALGETPPQELVSVAQPEEAVAKTERQAFPICSALEVISKGIGKINSEMEELKAGKYPYPYPARGRYPYPYPDRDRKPKEECEEEEEKKGESGTLLQAIEGLKGSIDKLVAMELAREKPEKEEEQKKAEDVDGAQSNTVPLSAFGQGRDHWRNRGTSTSSTI